MVRVKKVPSNELAKEMRRIIDELTKSGIEIKMTDHARDRAKMRHITFSEISLALMQRRQTIYDEVRDNYKTFGLVSNRYIVIVYTKLNSHAKVITVIPMDKKGLSKIGFTI